MVVPNNKYYWGEKTSSFETVQIYWATSELYASIQRIATHRCWLVLDTHTHTHLIQVPPFFHTYSPLLLFDIISRAAIAIYVLFSNTISINLKKSRSLQSKPLHIFGFVVPFYRLLLEWANQYIDDFVNFKRSRFLLWFQSRLTSY